MRKLGKALAERGMLVVNGVGFQTPIGDGSVFVYYNGTLPKGFELIPGVFFSFEKQPLILVSGFDCIPTGNEPWGVPNDIVIRPEDVDNSMFLQLAKDSENSFCFVKLF